MSHCLRELLISQNWKAHSAPGATDCNLQNLCHMPLKAARPGQLTVPCRGDFRVTQIPTWKQTFFIAQCQPVCAQGKGLGAFWNASLWWMRLAHSPFCERGCSVTVSHGTDSSVFRHAFLVAQCSLCAAWAQIIFRAPLAGWAIMWHIFFIARENFLIIHLLSSTNTFYLVSPYSLFSGGL